MSGQSDNRMESFRLQDLIAEARAMDAVILPPELRAQLTGFNVVRLRLLTTRNLLAAMLWASQNPVRFRCFWIHFLNPDLTQKEIAALLSVTPSAVRDYLASEVIPDSIWDELPELED